MTMLPPTIRRECTASTAVPWATRAERIRWWVATWTCAGSTFDVYFVAASGAAGVGIFQKRGGWVCDCCFRHFRHYRRVHRFHRRRCCWCWMDGRWCCGVVLPERKIFDLTTPWLRGHAVVDCHRLRLCRFCRHGSRHGGCRHPYPSVPAPPAPAPPVAVVVFVLPTPLPPEKEDAASSSPRSVWSRRALVSSKGGLRVGRRRRHRHHHFCHRRSCDSHSHHRRHRWNWNDRTMEKRRLFGMEKRRRRRRTKIYWKEDITIRRWKKSWQIC
mmetsp:Transcript_30678/g.64832  ORF Transcript_30678/g.64832 Transcript_30678/m.64832 type:complete len:271 (-) Transcript_30678:118-930(-)